MTRSAIRTRRFRSSRMKRNSAGSGLVEALQGNDVGECSRAFEILPGELTAPDIMDSPAMWTIQWS